ncbi:hypothetical protein FRC10_008593 [Ceratobasidium sp. 414]|nr:hypothetical protein FRC10_008593 [Ceratobasidium sp. 414]
MAGVAAAGVVAEVGQDAQGPTFQREPTTLDEQSEAIPALISPGAPPLVSGHVAPAPSGPLALALVPVPAPPVAPSSNVDLDIDLNPSPAQSTLTGSFYGTGGIQFADGMPELVAAIPAGHDVQEPTILQEDTMPNEAAPPHTPVFQPFAPVQVMPAGDVGVQPFVLVVDDNPVQQPLLRSLRGFEGIQFEDEGEGGDH